jgi:hopene-associated glycosyltransferase HpnB
LGGVLHTTPSQFVEIVALIPLAIWLYLVFARGGFWQVESFEDDATSAGTLPAWPRVVAIVPARNEAETIAKTVASLSQQNYPGEFSIIVVDDHSSDDTASLALQAAEHSGAPNRIAVHPAAALPLGWTGKLWALDEGVRAAEFGAAQQGAPEFFWFTDADIVHPPDTLRRLVTRAQHESLGLASLMVLLQAKTFPERLLIPPFLYFFLMLYPPRWISNPRNRTAGAAGGCILLRREALNAIGGLAAIRSEVIDDCALARSVKNTGAKICMGLTRSSISLRSYSSFHEIRDMIARTAFTQLRYSPFLLLGTLAGMLLTYVAPLALLFTHNSIAQILSLATWLLMTISFWPTARFYRLSPLWAPLLPLAAIFYSYATWLSAARYWLGRGGQWKGRAQAPKPT